MVALPKHLAMKLSRNSMKVSKIKMRAELRTISFAAANIGVITHYDSLPPYCRGFTFSNYKVRVQGRRIQQVLTFGKNCVSCLLPAVSVVERRYLAGSLRLAVALDKLEFDTALACRILNIYHLDVKVPRKLRQTRRYRGAAIA
nr:hypothetical protein CFP56_36495 [Quercus suber]